MPFSLGWYLLVRGCRLAFASLGSDCCRLLYMYTRRYAAAARESRLTTSRLIRCDTVQSGMVSAGARLSLTILSLGSYCCRCCVCSCLAALGASVHWAITDHPHGGQIAASLCILKARRHHHGMKVSGLGTYFPNLSFWGHCGDAREAVPTHQRSLAADENSIVDRLMQH